jgi:multiple sugar transport system substrate-binding protein
MKGQAMITPSKSLSRRSFLRLSGLAGGALALAACAAPGAAPAATPSAQGEGSVATSDAITLTWWNQYSTSSTQAAVPLMIEAFNETYPNIQVEYELSGGPPGGGNYTEILLARIAAGNPPDSATTWDPPAQFAARGSLAQLDDFMENAKWARPDAFFEGPMNSCRWQGSIYGLPASAGAGCLIYNVDMFAELGLPTAREEFPTTWQGLKELSATLTEWSGDELVRAGLVPWGTSWLHPVWSGLNGSQLFDADNLRYTIDTEENIEWVQFWRTWLDEQYQGDLERLNFYGPYGDAYAPGAFNSGVAGIIQSGSWACSDAEMPFAWEVVKFPVGPQGSRSVTGYWPNWWIVPHGAPNLQEAFYFSEFFCTKGWEIWYQYIMDTPAWRDFPDGVLTQQLVDEQGIERATEIHDFFAEYLNDTVNMWNSPVENFASDTLQASIEEVLHGQSTPEQALANAQTLIQSRLEETLRS